MLGTYYDQEARPSPSPCSRFVKLGSCVSASKPYADDVETRTELDSHMAICIAVHNTLFVSDNGRPVTLLPYSGELSPVRMFPLPQLQLCGFIPTMGNLASSISMRLCILGTGLM
jgi:hypothetical protein